MPADLVCQVIGKSDQITFIWSDGPASFEPYHLTGQGLLRFRDHAREARQRLSDLVKDYLHGSDEDVWMSSYGLALIGHRLYQQIFRPAAGAPQQVAKQVREWLAEMQARDAIESLEIVIDGLEPLPWNVVYEQEPDRQAFLSGAASPDRWQPFWGIRYNLAGGRRVEPLRHLPWLEAPRLVMVVDPVICQELPKDQQRRLQDFLRWHPDVTLVQTRDQLAGALDQRRPELMYWLSHATPKGLVLGDDEISPSDLLELLRRDEGDILGGLAFLNACRTAEAGVVGSFLDALHEVGLSGIIATEHQTVNTFAHPFGLEFLEAFLESGEPIGKLLQGLRSRRVPLGLLYGTYCPPGIRVYRPARATDGTAPIAEVPRRDGVALGTAPRTAGHPTRMATEWPRASTPLPDEPYRSLAAYGPRHRALFTGRDDDVQRFTLILDDPKTRILILHGESGVGKSSFLQAGVIPYLQDGCIGYFPRDAAQAEIQRTLLSIRATNDPAGQLAQALCDFCSRPYVHQRPHVQGEPLGPPAEVPLPELLAGALGQPPSVAVLRQALRSDAALLGRLLAALGNQLPHALVLVIDQMEEIFTLARTPDDAESRRRALEMFRQAVAAQGDFKIILSLRTEYYGRLVDRLRRGVRDVIGVREYLLTDFDEDGLVAAIRRPTLDEPLLPFTEEHPFTTYRFGYENGVPETIARGVLALPTSRQDSVLPSLQVICSQLYERVRVRAERTIGPADLAAIGGVEGGMRRHVEMMVAQLFPVNSADDATLRIIAARFYLEAAREQPDGPLRRVFARLYLRSVGEAPGAVIGPEEIRRIEQLELPELPDLGTVLKRGIRRILPNRVAFKQLFTQLYLCQPDGTLSTALVAEDDLAKRWRGSMPISELLALASAGQARLLRVNTLRIGGGEERRYVSLGHDALAKVAAEWDREEQQQQKLRSWRLALGSGVVAIVLLIAVATQYASAARRAEEELRRHRYVTQITAAQRAWQDGDVARMRDALESQRPGPGADDLRGFEWYYLWRLSNSDLPEPFLPLNIRCATVSRDGRMLALGLGDGTVEAWDTAARRRLPTFPGHKGKVLAVAWSADAQTIASGDDQGTIFIQKIEAGPGRVTCEEKEEEKSAVTCLAFSPDGRQLASGHENKRVKLWDPATGRPVEGIARLEHWGWVGAVAFKPGERVLASSGADDVIRLWDLETGKPRATTFRQRSSSNALAFSSNGQTLASGHRDGTVRLWDVGTGRELHSLPSHKGAVTSVAFSPDGGLVASGGLDAIGKVWQVSSGELLATLRGHSGTFVTVCFPDGAADGRGPGASATSLVSVSGDSAGRERGRFKRWSLPESQEAVTLRKHRRQVWDLAYSDVETLLASASSDATVQLWDAATARAREALGADAAGAGVESSGQGPRLLTVAIAPQGRMVAAAGDDGVIRLWDWAPGLRQAPRTLPARPRKVIRVRFLPDGKLAALTEPTDQVELWDVSQGADPTPTALRGHTDKIWDLAPTPRGKGLATWGSDGTVRIWDVTNNRGRIVLDGLGATYYQVAFSPDEEFVAVGNALGELTIYDLETKEARAALPGHVGPVWAMAFSSDGRTLASGGTDRSVRLWSMDTYQELLALEGHNDSVTSILFLPGDQVLATTSEDGTIKLWRAAAEAEAKPRGMSTKK